MQTVKICCLLLTLLLATSAQDAKLRILNSSPDSPPLDVFINGTVKFSNVIYTQATDYLAVPPNFHQIRVTPSDNHDKILFDGGLILSGGLSFSALTYGLILAENYTNTPFGVSFRVDRNDAPTTSLNTRIRFAHASPGTGPIQIKANQKEWVSAINYKSFSNYLEIPLHTQKSFTLQFYETNSTSNKPIFTLPNWSPVGGEVYTIVLSGMIGAVGKQALTANAYVDARYDYFWFRLANAIPFADLELTLGDNLIFSDISAQGVTEYIMRATGTYDVSIKSKKTGSSVTHQFTTEADQILTFVGVGRDNDTLDLIVLEDNNSAPSAQADARLRFVHTIEDAPNVDIQADQETEWFNDLGYKDSTEYKEVPAGDYCIEVFSVHNKNEPIMRLPRQTLKPGQVYTFFLEGSLKKKNVAFVTIPDVTYQYLTLSIAHLSPNAPKVDIYLDNTLTGTAFKLIFEDIGYQTVTEYKTFVVASNNNGTNINTLSLTVTEADKPDNVLFFIPSGFQFDSTNTLAIYGLVSAQIKAQYIILVDDNTPPSTNENAKVRLFHASSGLSGIDVRANDLPLFDHIAYGNVGDYIEIAAKEYQRLSIFPAGNLVDPLLVKDNVEFKKGAIYTIFVVGLKGEEKMPLDILKTLHASYSYVTISAAHASPDTDKVDIFVDKKKVFSKLEYTTESEEISLIAGSHWIDVKLSTSNTAASIISKKMYLSADRYHTLVISGLSKQSSPALDIFLVDNHWTLPSSDEKAKVRFVHVIAQLGEIDIFLNSTELVSKLAYMEVSDYMEVETNRLWDLAGYLSGTDDSRPLFASLNYFQPGSVYTFFGEGIYRSPKDNKIQVIPRADFTPPPNAWLRFIHTSPDMGSVDVLVNGEVHQFDLGFSENTDYFALLPGAYTFTIVPAGKLSPVFVELSGEPLAAGTYHTFLLWGMVKSNTLDCQKLVDDVTIGEDDQVKLRFIHASPNTPAIDVRLNGVETFSDVPYQSVSQYTVAKVNTYDMEVLIANENEKHRRLFREDFDWSQGPGVYTVIAEGILRQKNEPNFRVYSYLDAARSPLTPIKPPKDDGKDKKRKLSKGAAAAIAVVAAICGIGLVVGVTYLIVKRRRSGYQRIH